MSNQDIAKSMIDRLPSDKMVYVISILESLEEMFSVQPEPNEETLEAIDELDRGGGTFFDGSTQELFAELLNNP